MEELEANLTLCLDNLTAIACPQDNLYLTSEHEQKFFDIQSWDLCAGKCREDPECKAWQWVDKVCHSLKKNIKVHSGKYENAFCGTRNCSGMVNIT